MADCEHPHWLLIEIDKQIFQDTLRVQNDKADLEFDFYAKGRCLTCGAVDFRTFTRTISLEFSIEMVSPDAPDEDGGEFAGSY